MRTQLYFDFLNGEGVKSPKHFTNPTDIISTSSIEEVLPCLKRVQQAVNDGSYAAGYVSYEAAPAFDPTYKVNPSVNQPLVWFGIFDHPSKKSFTATGTYETAEWTPLTGKEVYVQNISRIKEAIRQGITYQVNYTIRMRSQFTGDSIAYYKQLAEAQTSNYSAYINDGKHTMISASPELFFHLKDKTMFTKPMKGTASRGNTLPLDIQQKDWLYQSAKNRAENVMIVDLLRNDLGRIAKPGTVKVPKLFSIESYPTVHQMTSTVTAELEETIELPDVFKALFPCGSITGAPKGSTMQIITELEEQPRNVYCGAIGYITPDMEAIFNVPIRTVILDNEKGNATYGVGGGITWDSESEEEYDEVLTKSKILRSEHNHFQLLESIGYTDGEFLVLENHLKRLKKSADYFNFQVDLVEIRKELTNLQQQLTEETKWKIRLLVNKDGSIQLESQPLKESTLPVKIELAAVPVDKDNLFLYHKTTNRSVYQALFQYAGETANDLLLWNQANEITECTTGNIVVEMDGKFYTPPVKCGLLPGTYREDLLNRGIIHERVIYKHEMQQCSGFWMINSVRGWVPIEITGIKKNYTYK
ncbi:aminodeoxychorismate synthase component I [Oceanobacillus picturae]|uniref:aminodeoxychorismate synthase component I n=1 Tax=Oceanobacillus picturae TaxID=171693 RepID=UPI000E6819FD|nr:aminodeoxychorismate synthase component I [Oceanobacillus picturae]RIU88821.1 aminodeoxychorismate synthase component I [Oceanobacillus picturae]